MADERVQLPSGMGGLVRYFDDAKSKIRFKPEHVVAFVVIVIVVEILLQTL
ncbi:MAG: SEC61-beta family protein [Nanoarchaeota archaeon]